MTAFQGPEFSNQTGAGSGTLLDEAHLNALVLAQVSYLQNGTVPTTATGANPPIITQPQVTYVINSGTACTWHNITTTTPISPASASVAQDLYCDVDDTEVFTIYQGAVGFTPPAPAVNALRLWKATTGAGNVGISGPFTNLANPYPLGAASFMAQDGSNAVAVAFPSTLDVVGGSTLEGGVTVQAGIVRYVSQPTSTPTKGAGMSGSSTITQIAGGSQNGLLRTQILGSNTNPAQVLASVAINSMGFTPIGVDVTIDGGAAIYATIPTGSGSAWSFDLHTLAALTTSASIYNITYEVIYQ